MLVLSVTYILFAPLYPFIRISIQIKREIISVSAFWRHRSQSTSNREYNARYHYRRRRWRHRINEIINNLVCVSTRHTTKMRSATFFSPAASFCLLFFSVVVCWHILSPACVACVQQRLPSSFSVYICLSFRMLHISLLCVWCVANERKLSMIRPINKIVPLNVCVRHFFFYCSLSRRVLPIASSVNHSSCSVGIFFLLQKFVHYHHCESVHGFPTETAINSERDFSLCCRFVFFFFGFVHFFGQPFI